MGCTVVPFDKKSFIVPDGTRFEEHTVVAPADVILGNHVKLQFGLDAQGRVFGGESVDVGGHIRTAKELRLDYFCRVDGNVEAGGNVYLGEKSRIQGKLLVGGDLDVGDDVAIAQGFEAKGWINIRSPVPLVVYVFLYLLELLRMGKSEEVERLVTELEQAQEKIQIQEGFLYVPDGSTVGLQDSSIKGNMLVGRGCRLLGNFTVHGNVIVGPESRIYGAVRAAGQIKVQAHVEVQGTLEASQGIIIGESCHVLGDVRAQSVDLFHSAVVDGRIVAPGGIRFSSRQSLEVEEKVERFAAGMRDDIVDLLG